MCRLHEHRAGVGHRGQTGFAQQPDIVPQRDRCKQGAQVLGRRSLPPFRRARQFDDRQLLQRSRQRHDRVHPFQERACRLGVFNHPVFEARRDSNHAGRECFVQVWQVTFDTEIERIGHQVQTARWRGHGRVALVSLVSEHLAQPPVGRCRRA